MSTLIKTLDDFTAKFEGFGDPDSTDVKEEKGFTRVLAGPDHLYRDTAPGRFPSQRLQVGYHHFEESVDHEPHYHETWEQFYFVIAGTARITVGDEQRIVGPGGMAYLPAGVMHSFEAVGGPLDLLLAGAVLDE